MATGAEILTHRLINRERRKRGIPPVRWSREMYRLAKDQAHYCARRGEMVHSGRCALQGGENLCGGEGHYSPRSFVRIWLRSPRHREWMLSPKVKTVAVGIASSKKGMYAAWSFTGREEQLKISLGWILLWLIAMPVGIILYSLGLIWGFLKKLAYKL